MGLLDMFVTGEVVASAVAAAIEVKTYRKITVPIEGARRRLSDPGYIEFNEGNTDYAKLYIVLRHHHMFCDVADLRALKDAIEKTIAEIDK